MNPPGVDIVQQLDARDLAVVLAVAEACSFRRAAARLGIGQAAVSRRVRRVEDLLGVSLFERGPAGTRLTFAGSEFVACASAVFENLNAAVTRAQTVAVGSEGMLRIGSMTSFSNGPQRRLLQTFMDRHPAIQLSFVECGRRRMMTMLGHRALDLVIASGEPDAADGDGLVLTHAPVYLAAASDGAWANARRLHWREIVDAPFIVSAREAGPDIHDYIVRRVTTFSKAVSITRHQISRDGVLNLVGLGLGVTIVGDHAVGARYPNVTLIPLGGEDDRVPFSLYWRPENDNPALRRFISLARLEAKRNGIVS